MAMYHRLNDVQIFSGDGTIKPYNSIVVLTEADVSTITIPDPSKTSNGTRIQIVSTTAQAHTVSGTINGSSQTGTFGGAIGDGFTLVAYAGGWYVVSNINVTVA